MKKTYILLGFILLLGFALRLYRIDNPIADWHSWRQADTSSVTRELLKNDFDLLHPRFQDLSNVASGLDNPEGYRFVEFPIYNTVQGFLYLSFQTFTLEVWGRVATIFSVLLSITFLFGIVNRYFGKTAALCSAFFYAVLPFSIFYGRVILPDPMMTMSFLGAIYFFSRCVDTKDQSLLVRYVFFSVSLFLASISLLLKPFAGFFLIPLALISYQLFGFALFKKIPLYVYALLTVIPLLLWRWWMLQFPEGIPANEWLFNGGNIRFTGAFFYWIFADRIARLILGYWGIGLFVIGLVVLSLRTNLVSLRKGRSWIVVSFLLSSLLYLFVVARGNVQHDYYQIPIVPSLVMVMGIGSSFLLSPPKEYHMWIMRGKLVGLTVLMLFFSWYFVRDYFNVNNPNIVIAGEAVDKLTPKDANIVTFYDGDTSFLYQTKRKGWSSLQDPLSVLVEKGAEYLVIVNPTEKDREGVGKEYTVISSTNEYLLLELRK